MIPCCKHLSQLLRLGIYSRSGQILISPTWHLLSNNQELKINTIHGVEVWNRNDDIHSHPILVAHSENSQSVALIFAAPLRMKIYLLHQRMAWSRPRFVSHEGRVNNRTLPKHSLRWFLHGYISPPLQEVQQYIKQILYTSIYMECVVLSTIGRLTLSLLPP